jgi:hypothetical protein
MPPPQNISRAGVAYVTRESLILNNVKFIPELSWSFLNIHLNLSGDTDIGLHNHLLNNLFNST